MFRTLRRHPILYSLLALIVVLIALGIARSRRPKLTAVRVAPVKQMKSLTAIVRASGAIRAHEMVDIQTEVAGVIVELPVVEGQRVEKDQVLLRVDPFQSETELASARAQYAASQADVKRAEAALASATADLDRAKEQITMSETELAEAQITAGRDRASLDRYESLLKKNSASKDEFEVVEAKYRISVQRVESAQARIRQTNAQLQVGALTIEQQRALKKAAEENLAAAAAALQRAEDQLRKVTILSPLDGVVVALNVDVGERAVPGILSNPQATLMTIANMSVIEAEIEVDETDIVRVALDQEAQIDVDALPDDPLKGRITEIGSAPIVDLTATQEGKDFKVVIAIADPPEALRVGMSCETEITVDTRQDILTIPIQALTAREVAVDAAGNYTPPPEPVDDGKDAKAGEKKEPNSDKSEEPEKKELEGVFVKGKDERAHFRPIEVGIMGESDVEVLKGLDAGEEVVTGPLQALREIQEWTRVKLDDDSTPATPEGK